jgi:hypothetical protein
MSAQHPDQRISRRRMIKRIGAGTAIVWSAPALTTLGSRAFAQVYGPCQTCSPCFGPECGNDNCFCVPQVSEEGCFCHQAQACSSFQTCTPDTICPDGTECAQTCCTPGPARCVPACGTGASLAALPVGTMTTAGVVTAEGGLAPPGQ